MTAVTVPVLTHKASLPYCCYDKRSKMIILRVIVAGDIDTITLLHGDPYNWDLPPGTAPADKNAKWGWSFAEEPLYPQHTVGEPNTEPSRRVWKIEIPLPRRRRLKYGFRVRIRKQDYYFSENGLEPFTAEAVNVPHNHFFYPFIHDIDVPDSPGWVRNTIWYQIFPDRFCKGNSEGISQAGTTKPREKLDDWETGVPTYRNFFGGNLAGVRQQLSYLSDLGITGIYFTPLFTSPSNHKYNTEDYFTIDTLFGTLDELKALVKEAHSRGIRVMLDAVFNHIGESHPFWQDVLKNQENSPYKDYFHIRRFPIKKGRQERDALDFETFAYAPSMPKWNTENPEARKYLLDAAAYWIRECDIDGWRLDVANEVSLDFWHEFSRLVRSLKKEFYIVGEVWHDASNWINPGYFDASMNYPLEYAISHYFLTGSSNAVLFNEQLILSLTRYSDLHNRMAFNLLDSHDTDRVLTRCGEDKQRLRNAFAMLFLLPGSPCIYYGTEVGMTGGGDPDCRKPMIWNEAKQDRELLAFFKELIAFRKKYIAVISHGVIRYGSAAGGLRCWEIGNFDAGNFVTGGDTVGGSVLTAVYNETAHTAALDLQTDPGECVFTTAPTSKPHAGEVPPWQLAIYFKQM
ncbi:alpha-glycosidase [Betaproteobacteria bacterium]|nr:alpha-glycosidase [Betaproteobacteria bacterium]